MQMNSSHVYSGIPTLGAYRTVNWGLWTTPIVLLTYKQAVTCWARLVFFSLFYRRTHFKNDFLRSVTFRKFKSNSPQTCEAPLRKRLLMFSRKLEMANVFTATAKPGFGCLHMLNKHRLDWESHGRRWQSRCEEYAPAAMTFLSLFPPLIFSRGFYHRQRWKLFF